ncbi:MAG: aldehyde dehydrogenase family protein [Desulfobulbaceae bacterium]|nr:aldehyde dehydrogenase family protein [Desulfobulbaceae bacterium]
MAWEFVRALHRALDTIGNPALNPLRSAVSVVHISATDYLEHLAVNAWNYVFFGDDATMRLVEETLRQACRPRRIIGYGTGLSTTVIGEQCAWETYLDQIVDSIVVNTGNECVSTDVIYVPAVISAEFHSALRKQLSVIRHVDPMDEKSIGVARVENATFIAGELTRKGKISSLLEAGMLNTIPLSLALTDYDAAIEYPGPIVSVRGYGDRAHLGQLVSKELRDNGKERNLATSVFTDSLAEFECILPLLRAYNVKRNLPTHRFDPFQPHQGFYLLRELMESIWIERI